MHYLTITHTWPLPYAVGRCRTARHQTLLAVGLQVSVLGLAVVSRNLHLLALGVGQKDNKGGVTGTLGDELAAVEAIEGRVWEVEVAEGEEGEARTYSVPTSLSVTVDLCAERDLGGMIGGGCHCQGAEMLHRYPRDRRASFTTLEQVLEWCSACEEPTLEEQFALAHHPLPGEQVPQPCPAEGC